LAGCCECGDEPSGSCATELVIKRRGCRGTSVSVVSGYGLEDRSIDFRSPAEAKRIFSLVSVSRQALEPTQPPVHWTLGVLSPGVNSG
jgi:hypothetical protein